jgi:hypothetical protein
MEGRVGTIDDDMRRVVEEQRLGYAATVCPNATSNLSPKGTTAVWDDDHLDFADIRSPRTIENLRHNQAIEINVVDPISRKGYRFKGAGTVLSEGNLFEEALAFYRERGLPTRSGPSCSWSRTRHAAHVSGLRPRRDRAGGTRAVGAPSRGATLGRERSPTGE